MILSQNRPWWQEISLVFFLFAPSMYFGNEYLSLLIPLLLLLFDFKKWKSIFIDFIENPTSKKHIRYVWLLSIFCLLALLNKIFFGQIRCLKDYYSPFFLLPILLLSAYKFFSNRTFLIVLIFVSIECVIGYFEFYFNVRTFFSPITDELIIQSKDSLYYSHVFGLTNNSSIFALHILVAFICLYRVVVKPFYFWLFFLIFMTGVVVSFNRTLIVVLGYFFLIEMIVYFIQNKRQILNIRFMSYLAVVIVFFTFYFLPITQRSFDRGGTEQIAYNTSKKISKRNNTKLACNKANAKLMLEPNELDTSKVLTKSLLVTTQNFNTSGRKLIWMNYINYVEENPWVGNGSNKLMLRTTQPTTGETELFHAHNSFLMLFSTYGIPLGLFMLILLFLWWKKSHFTILSTIILYSMLQYGIFWGFSILDLVFLFFLISPNFQNVGHQEVNQ